MKKQYIIPTAKTIALSTEEGVLNVGSPQGGLNNGDGLGNQKVGGGTSNDYSNRRNSIWGDEY